MLKVQHFEKKKIGEKTFSNFPLKVRGTPWKHNDKSSRVIFPDNDLGQLCSSMTTAPITPSQLRCGQLCWWELRFASKNQGRSKNLRAAYAIGPWLYGSHDHRWKDLSSLYSASNIFSGFPSHATEHHDIYIWDYPLSAVSLKSLKVEGKVSGTWYPTPSKFGN